MQVILNVPDNLPKKIVQKRLKEFEKELREEGETLAKQGEEDKDERNFNAAARSQEIRKLFSRLSQQL